MVNPLKMDKFVTKTQQNYYENLPSIELDDFELALPNRVVHNQEDEDDKEEYYNEDEIWEGDISQMSNSPYPEVRRVVPITDDPTIDINHWRTWFLTTLFVIIFSGVNQFFAFRYPSLKVSYLIAQILSYPIGKALERLPDLNFHNSWFNLNQGPYTVKEHGILTICVSLTASATYATEIIIAQTHFYKKDFGIIYQLFLVWSTQSLGYGLAGLTRRVLVDPPSMIWPQTLINIAMFDTLHGKDIEQGSNSYKFFFIGLIASFLWYWVPGYLFTGLSYFNFMLWVPWLKDNFVANCYFGVKSGLGLIPITFDYTQISQALSGSVFVTPYWVVVNIYSSVVIFFVGILSALYFANVWYSKYLPVISNSTFNKFQEKFDVTRILNDDFTINYDKYRQYSPLFIPLSYLLSYGLNFAGVIAIFTHTVLYSGSNIMNKIKSVNNEGQDIHKRLMNNYKEVPDSWYIILFVVVLLMSFITVTYWETGLPWWALVLALSISIVNFVPQGMLEGITNQTIGLNVITELICGYILPYRPLANVLFKIYGFIVMRHGLSLTMDLKMGRYLKIQPRLLFFMQIWSTFIAGITTVSVQNWMVRNIDSICSPTQPDGFICAGGRTIFNASIIWSIPKHLFSPGEMYAPLLWFFLIGLISPFITFYLFKKYPEKWYGKINAPVFFSGPTNIPPSTPYNYGVYFLAATLLMNIKKVWPRWYNAKNLILGASIETGVALAVVIIFLGLQYRGNNVNWWGNTIWKDTMDYRGEPYRKLQEGQTIL